MIAARGLSPFTTSLRLQRASDTQVPAAACAVRPPLPLGSVKRVHRGRRSSEALLRRGRCRSERDLAISCSANSCEQALAPKTLGHRCSRHRVDFVQSTQISVSSGTAPKEMMSRDLSSPSVGCGQSQFHPEESAVCNIEHFTCFFINLRGFVSHSAELVGVIEELRFPPFACQNETLLPGERAMPNIVLD